MRFGICVDMGRPWAEVRRIVELADEQDWQTVYVSDHFMPYTPSGLPAVGHVLESWTVLSALGALTSRVRLGSLVLGNTYRHPAVVANMATTLDNLTGGRLVLGLGAGWQENEHTAYGIDLPPVRERMDRFEESCRVISSLLRQPRTTFDGTYYRLADASVQPSPASSRLPIMVGGAGERRTLRIAARFADVWHAWAGPKEFARKCDVLDRHCAEVGRDPATVGRANGQVVQVRSSPTEVSEESDITGTAGQVVEALAEYASSRVSEFIVRDHRNTSVDLTLETMSVLTAEVIPEFA